MKRMFFGWLIRELEIINTKLDHLIDEMDNLEIVARDTAKLKRATEELQQAINQQQTGRKT
jgi:hypothetical protein